MAYGQHYPADGDILDAILLKGGYVVGELKEVHLLPPGKGKLAFDVFAKDTASEIDGSYEIQLIAQESDDVRAHQILKGVSISHRADGKGHYGFSYTDRNACHTLFHRTGKRTKTERTPWERLD